MVAVPFIPRLLLGPATAAVDCKVASKTTKSQNSKLFQDFVRQSEKTMPGMVF
ncbi:hypothetical protein CHCC20488_4138 [Bacillus paralicheniformis]|uniref:Uncharacterized protein n=1 Tax=Bacillus paralicheniformis TaxID=1648923 RepID=A0ABY3FU35_9BACI|nr:hypothetical protein CHCC20497_2661 [Bacillus paralicheniformis]TWK28452.1 hypothetical protein CHCC20372_1087 [Bacillus paralicheniformis]TWL36494.1 hypothetical protein CHCC15381_3084 [Bacillus paralicheniformis]TWN42733.1 hypothetical protein CHCC14523_0829 [Bacillus paralicheniformis]TWN85674.1 hypothetical protein CHCC20492_0933 [Bacillus paralicheniformis]